MKMRIRGLLGLVSLLWIGGVSGALADVPAGLWKGAIEVPGSTLLIEVDLRQEEGDRWSGSITIPAQGLKGYALSDVVVDVERVAFAMEGIPGRPQFEGTPADGKKIAGQFTQGGQALRFHLDYVGDPAERETAVAAPTVGVPGEGVVGEWLGVLSLGPMKLRIALHLRANEAGELSGAIDSLDQGASGIPIDRATFEKGTLEFSIFQINGTFEGTLNDNGSEIVGTWSQYGNSSPLAFLRQTEAATISRPQEPVPPFPYDAREVVFRNEWADIELSGTYLVPEGSGPFPAVVFVSGSGPQDRDEALMGHRPFLVIADYLARRGIASLRYDDRGVGRSGGNHMDSNVDDFATDALAAVEFMTRQREVDTDSVGIIGHSEGGVTAPMVANRSHCVSFLVLLAAPGEPLDRLLMRQFEVMSRQAGVDVALIERIAEIQRRELEWIKDPALDRSALKKALMESWLEQKPTLTELEMQQLQLTDQRVKQNIDLVATTWFRSLMRVDPATYLESVTIPVLALYGEKDIQVAAEVNAAAVRAALERAGNRDSRVEVLSGLNHLFQNSPTGSIAEYGQIEETFDPATLALVADWIRERF